MTLRFSSLSKFFLYLVPLAVLIVTPSTLFPFIVGKYTYFKVVVELALLFALLAWGFELRAFSDISLRKIYKNPLFIAVSLFVFVFSIAGLLGVNPHASFWSSFERGEGVFLLLHCYIFFTLSLLLLRKEEEWRRIFSIFVITGLLMITYGVFAALDVAGFLGKDICTRFAGSLGNPSYVGTFSLFMIFYVAYLMVTGDLSSRIWQRRVFPLMALSLLTFLIFLVLSQTRGAILGLGFGTIAGLLYIILSLRERRARVILLVAILAMLLVGFLGIYFRGSINLLPFCSAESGGGNRILDVSLKTESYQTRWLLWGQSLLAFKERPILGWGIENFSAAFEKYFDIRHRVWFDRAHNIFFDYLVSAGILGLVSFLGIFGAFYAQLIKLAEPYAIAPPKYAKSGNFWSGLQRYKPLLEQALMFALPTAYLVQGLVLFDVLPTYINLFLFLAFAVYKFESWRSIKNHA